MMILGSMRICCMVEVAEVERWYSKFCKENGASPNILMSVLLTRAVHRIAPDNKKTVSTLVAVDPKAVLGVSESSYNF